MFLIVIFIICRQLLGASPPDPHRGSAPGHCWGTSVPQNPWFRPPSLISKPTTHSWNRAANWLGPALPTKNVKTLKDVLDYT